MITNVVTMSKELEHCTDSTRYPSPCSRRTNEEIAKIEECCVTFLRDGEKQVGKLNEIIILENRTRVPTKEYP